MSRLLITIVAYISLCSLATAQTRWPERPVTLVVPFAAGGNTDAVARVTADYLQKTLNSAFVVENRGGGGGIVGTAQVARSSPEGYTFCVCSIGSITVAPSLEKLTYEPLGDLEPISVLSTNALVVVTPPALGIDTVPDLIRFAKAKPDSIEYGSSGVGGLMHISALLFQARTGTTFTHVPFRGGAPAVGAALANQVKLVFANMSDALPQIEGGTLKALAVTTKARSPQLPNVPTLAEAGVADFDVQSWNGLFAPKGTPKAVTDRLGAAIAAMAKDPDVIRRFATFGSQTAANTPERYREELIAETAQWREVLRDAGLLKAH